MSVLKLKSVIISVKFVNSCITPFLRYMYKILSNCELLVAFSFPGDRMGGVSDVRVLYFYYMTSHFPKKKGFNG